MGLRILAVLPLLASIVAVALTITILASGNSTGNANDNFWIALNTSGVGGNLVEIQPASNSGGSSSDPLGGIINGIPGLGSVLDNITSGIGQGVSDLQGDIIGNLTQVIGLRDMYVLYVSKICEGNLASQGSSSVKIEQCASYHDKAAGLVNITNSIPDDFTIANAEVSVPLVKSLKSTLTSVSNLAVGGATAMMVLLIIGTISSALTAVGSGLGILRSQARFITLFNLGFSSLAALVLFTLAIVVTAIVAAGTTLINKFGSGFSIHVKASAAFLALIWVAAIMAFIANGYWFAVWFVEFRKTAFSRRSRTESQIGSWFGVIGEVRRDLKTDGHFGGPSYDKPYRKGDA